jgi:nitrite reductase/ring-hydroxylating ferredoxin subunit
VWQTVHHAPGATRVLVPGTHEIPEGEARSVLVGDPDHDGFVALLCRVGGVLHALDARCPHEGGMLGEGPLMGKGEVLCPLHHYHFDARTGREAQGLCAPARKLAVVESDGSAEILL